MMRLSFMVATALLLSACNDTHVPISQPLVPIQMIEVTHVLGTHSLLRPLMRPAPILGVLVTHYLAQIPTPVILTPTWIGILQQEKLLREGALTERDAQTSLEQLGSLIQTSVPDLLNRSINRADALNTYIDMLNGAIVEAQIQHTLLKTFLDEVSKTSSVTKKTLRAEQKKQNKLVKNRQFAEASAIQERLLALHRDLVDIEFKKNEAERIQKLLAEVMEISQKRIIALQENREILIAGLSVKDLPGMDDLGILKTTKRRGLLR